MNIRVTILSDVSREQRVYFRKEIREGQGIFHFYRMEKGESFRKGSSGMHLFIWWMKWDTPL